MLFFKGCCFVCKVIPTIQGKWLTVHVHRELSQKWQQENRELDAACGYLETGIATEHVLHKLPQVPESTETRV